MIEVHASRTVDDMPRLGLRLGPDDNAPSPLLNAVLRRASRFAFNAKPIGTTNEKRFAGP
jgi:hypothetical protein